MGDAVRVLQVVNVRFGMGGRCSTRVAGGKCKVWDGWEMQYACCRW